MSNARKLLFLTTDLPFPATSGGTIKSFRLLEFLCAHFEVELVCSKGGDPSAVAALEQQLSIKVHGFEIEKGRSATDWIISILTAPSLNAWRNHNSNISPLVTKLCKTADYVVADHLETMHLLPSRIEGKLIYHSHNSEFRLWQEMATRQSSAAKRLAIQLEASRVALFERKSILRSQLTFAAPNDIETLQKGLAVPEQRFAVTYHLGNDALLEMPAIALQQNRPQVFYAGTLSWEPNSDGLKWFIKHIWPKVLATEGSAALMVCGKGADEELTQLLTNSQGVHYLGFVDNLEAIMSTCRAAIVPLRFGSGMKIKTFDALYRGLPLVTTSIGAEGIDIENETHALVTDDPKEFSEALVKLLSQLSYADELRNNGRTLAEKYTYAQMLPTMLEAIEKI